MRAGIVHSCVGVLLNDFFLFGAQFTYESKNLTFFTRLGETNISNSHLHVCLNSLLIPILSRVALSVRIVSKHHPFHMCFHHLSDEML